MSIKVENTDIALEVNPVIDPETGECIGYSLDYEDRNGSGFIALHKDQVDMPHELEEEMRGLIIKRRAIELARRDAENKVIEAAANAYKYVMKFSA